MARDDDDPEPKGLQPIDLDVMSIEALGAYIDRLNAEIARVRAVIDSKKTAKNVADSFFKS